MRISFDYHGVCDVNPILFSKLTKSLMDCGIEVFIITGRMKEHNLEEDLNKLGISFTGIFSIIDYNVKKGNHVRFDENGEPWIEEDLWLKTKGVICEEQKIDLHFDDSDEYSEHFSTPYARFYNNKNN
jgi:hypothetical protein|tara:strand:- start:19177 stop:19560 length:384 start_codon:yes stop_codon:yes gene_type:complete